METPQTFNDWLPVPIIKSCAPRNWMEKLSGSLMSWSQYILSFLPWMNANLTCNPIMNCCARINWIGKLVLTFLVDAYLHTHSFHQFFFLYVHTFLTDICVCVCVCICTCIFVFAVSDAYFTLTPTPSPNPSSCITLFRRQPRFIALKTPCHSIYRFILSFSSTKLHKRFILVTLVSL